MADPAPHPWPPPELTAAHLPLTTNPGPWYRIHPKGYPDPRFFGKNLLYRFDDPEQQFGVLYVALDFAGCFIEVYGDRRTTKGIAVKQLQGAHASTLRATRDARLVELRDNGLARLPGNADARLVAGGDYAISQAWARAFHEHPDQPDGIIYRARRNLGQFSIALFERFAPHVEVESTGPVLEHPELERTLDMYTIGIFGSF